MDATTSVGIQQSMSQSRMGTSMLKQQARAERAIVEIIQQSASPSSGRGLNLDITV